MLKTCTSQMLQTCSHMFPAALQVTPAKGQGSWIDHRLPQLESIGILWIWSDLSQCVHVCLYLFRSDHKAVKPRGPYLSFDTEAAAALWHWPIYLFALHFFVQICFWCRIHSREVLVDKPDANMFKLHSHVHDLWSAKSATTSWTQIEEFNESFSTVTVLSWGRPLITSHEIGWRPSIERFGVSAELKCLPNMYGTMHVTWGKNVSCNNVTGINHVSIVWCAKRCSQLATVCQASILCGSANRQCSRRKQLSHPEFASHQVSLLVWIALKSHNLQDSFFSFLQMLIHFASVVTFPYCKAKASMASSVILEFGPTTDGSELQLGSSGQNLVFSSKRSTASSLDLIINQGEVKFAIARTVTCQDFCCFRILSLGVASTGTFRGQDRPHRDHERDMRDIDIGPIFSFFLTIRQQLTSARTGQGWREFLSDSLKHSWLPKSLWPHKPALIDILAEIFPQEKPQWFWIEVLLWPIVSLFSASCAKNIPGFERHFYQQLPNKNGGPPKQTSGLTIFGPFLCWIEVLL